MRASASRAKPRCACGDDRAGTARSDAWRGLLAGALGGAAGLLGRREAHRDEAAQQIGLARDDVHRHVPCRAVAAHAGDRLVVA
jgi:hypothetical protein